jgi:TonB family protein
MRVSAFTVALVAVLLLSGSLAYASTIDSSSVVSRVAPVYPEIAKRMNVSGIVEINVVVDETGRPTEVAATSGPAMLRAAAEAAVKQWKFKPEAGKGQIKINFGN